MPLYFAFGSNLSRARLAARVHVERDLGRSRLAGWQFTCDKHGSDESAKANLVRRAGGEVWGVTYALSTEALAQLDGFEGGYERVEVEVVAGTSRQTAFTYVSAHRNPSLLPFDWYKAHMVEGAVEHHLPEPHVARLMALESRRDPRR